VFSESPCRASTTLADTSLSLLVWSCLTSSSTLARFASGESLSPSFFLFLLLSELSEPFVPDEPLGPGVSPLSLVNVWLVEPQSISSGLSKLYFHP